MNILNVLNIIPKVTIYCMQVFYQKKGIIELIQSFWNEAKLKNLILKIAGETNNLSIEDLGIQNKSVEILGYIPHTKLLDIMQMRVFRGYRN